MMFTITKKQFCTVAIMVLALLSVTFTSCKDDDEASQSYNFLESFGPCPVARGGVLTFLGADLSSVQSVEFPGGETVTPVFDGKGKFTVTVPASAQPGVLTLHTTKGDIQTLSPVSFSEAVTISGFSPSEQRPGNEVSLKGEYLSNATSLNIGQVKIPLQPATDEQTALFDQYIKSLTNDEIIFVVPAEAVTSELSLTDGQPVVAGTLTVTLPKFTSWAKDAGLVPGTDEVTLNGSDIDLISKITFANGVVVEAGDITTSATKATFALPLAAGDGAVTLTTVSGVDIEAGSISIVKPEVTSFGPVDELNAYPYCDDLLFIKGSNLSLVKEIVLANNAANEQSVWSFVASGDDEIQFAIPELTSTSMVWSNEANDNVPDGDLYIVTQSGERIQVSSADNKLRIGWSNIGAPADYSIAAGDKVVMTGCTNTAYMTKVEAGGVEVEFSRDAKDSYSFVWPLTNPGSNMILRVYYSNGDNNSNEWGTRFEVAASSKIFVTTLPDILKNGSPSLISGGNFDKVTKVTINGDEQIFALTDATTLFVNVTGVTKSPAEIKFIAADDADSFTAVVPVDGLALPVVPIQLSTGSPISFPITGSWDSNCQCYLAKSAQLDKYIAVGAKMTFKVTVGDGGGQWQINDPSWTAYTTLAEWSLTGQDVDLVLELTQEMVDAYNALSDGDTWIIMQGAGLAINYIELL